MADPPYAVHPSVPYAQSILARLPETTGRSIDAWVALLAASGAQGAKERTAWLKTEHGVGGTKASLIVSVAQGDEADRYDEDAYLAKAADFVEAMYAKKPDLRPLHDAVLAVARALGDDVGVSPCKTIVPLYRRHVFAQIKPSTRTRLDLGLALAGCEEPLPERLIDTGGLAKGDRITHRIALTPSDAEGVDDVVDDVVRRWLRVAYELDG